MVSTKVILTATAIAAPLVAGHGYMGLPKVNFPRGGDITSPAGTINSGQFKAPNGMSFTTDPTSNTRAFTAWIKTSEFSSLKDLIVKKGNIGECGNSAVGDAQPLPDSVEWTHGAGEGFTPSHEGPCEVWCDDKMAFHDDNCAKNYPSAPAKLPIDKSKCAGAKKLTTYWLALHSPDWQMYVNCAAIESRGGDSNPAPGPAPATRTPTVRPATPSTNSPPAATPAPAPDAYDDEDCDDDLPEPDADCDDDLPEPDCDDDLPEPSDGAAGEADCDDDLPEPDCDDDLPEPDADCDDDLPEPDCDDDLPEPEYGGESDVKTTDINFDTYKQRSADEAPGRVYPENF